MAESGFRLLSCREKAVNNLERCHILGQLNFDTELASQARAEIFSLMFLCLKKKEEYV